VLREYNTAAAAIALQEEGANSFIMGARAPQDEEDEEYGAPLVQRRKRRERPPRRKSREALSHRQRRPEPTPQEPSKPASAVTDHVDVLY
jgi:hypothetical protein